MAGAPARRCCSEGRRNGYAGRASRVPGENIREVATPRRLRFHEGNSPYQRRQIQKNRPPPTILQLALGLNHAPLSPIKFSSGPDAQDENEKPFIDNLADQAVVADPIFPEFTEFRALQCLA